MACNSNSLGKLEMTVLTDYLHKQEELKKLQEELLSLESDERLKNEMAFKNQLEEMMTEFGKSKREVIALLDPNYYSSGANKNAAQDGRKKRKLKVFKNPHTGEVIETRGGNHKGLRAWKDEYGEDTVNSWLESEHD